MVLNTVLPGQTAGIARRNVGEIGLRYCGLIWVMQRNSCYFFFSTPLLESETPPLPAVGGAEYFLISPTEVGEDQEDVKHGVTAASLGDACVASLGEATVGKFMRIPSALNSAGRCIIALSNGSAML